MLIFKEIDPLRAHLSGKRKVTNSLGLVPTMGALHEGHLSLIRQALGENDLVVATIFVNPTQFNNPADLEKYPRTLEADSRMLEEAGCHILFCPDAQEMYPHPSPLGFQFGKTGNVLEGEFRPGHFNGVGLIVAKLFNIVQPDKAYFGLKDYQQWIIINQLVSELRFPINLVPVRIFREPDGLAMSSRNRRLTPPQRSQAPQLYRCLLEARTQLLNGQPLKDVKIWSEQFLANHEIRLEYLELADRKSLTVLTSINQPNDAVLLIAAYLGEIRLIDNVFLQEDRLR